MHTNLLERLRISRIETSSQIDHRETLKEIRKRLTETEKKGNRKKQAFVKSGEPKVSQVQVICSNSRFPEERRREREANRKR